MSCRKVKSVFVSWQAWSKFFIKKILPLTSIMTNELEANDIHSNCPFMKM